VLYKSRIIIIIIIIIITGEL